MAGTWRELWDFDDPGGSEARFRRAADGAPPADAALLRTQVARALGLQGRYAEADRELDALAALDDPSPQLVVRTALERGRVRRSSGDLAAAAQLFDEAARLATRDGLDALRVDALHMVALSTSDPQEQLVAHERALAVARESVDPEARRWEASLLNNLGMTRHDLGDLEGALVAFEAALAAREREGVRRETQIARWMVAWTLRLLGRTDEALALQRALKSDLVAAGESDEYVDAELALLEGPRG